MPRKETGHMRERENRNLLGLEEKRRKGVGSGGKNQEDKERKNKAKSSEWRRRKGYV